jgi:hypothetical protein
LGGVGGTGQSGDSGRGGGTARNDSRPYPISSPSSHLTSAFAFGEAEWQGGGDAARQHAASISGAFQRVSLAVMMASLVVLQALVSATVIISNASIHSGNATVTGDTKDYCGTTYADADSRCHAGCLTNSDCNTFKNEKCFAQCTSCKINPTPAPTPPPAPTPKLQPLIEPGCPSAHPPGSIGLQCAESIAKVWYKAGGSEATCRLSVSVSLAESGGDAHVQGPNSDGSIDRGLWQLNSRWHPEVQDSCAYDPVCNGKATLRISNKGTDFSTWVTFQQGINKKFLTVAGEGCSKVPPPKPATPTPAPTPPPTPKPATPTPAPLATYKCESNKCKLKAGGVSKTICEENCGQTPAPPTPAPLATYKCESNKCKLRAGGVSKKLCKANCGQTPTPAPPTPAPANTYKCESNKCELRAGGVSKTLCDANCGQTPTPAPLTTYKCIANQCTLRAGGVSKTLCTANCGQTPAPPTPGPPVPPPPTPGPPVPPPPTPSPPVPPGPVPTPPPPGPVHKTCHAISKLVTDSWCNENCNNIPPHCPPNDCKCT